MYCSPYLSHTPDPTSWVVLIFYIPRKAPLLQPSKIFLFAKSSLYDCISQSLLLFTEINVISELWAPQHLLVLLLQSLINLVLCWWELSLPSEGKDVRANFTSGHTLQQLSLCFVQSSRLKIMCRIKCSLQIFLRNIISTSVPSVSDLIPQLYSAWRLYSQVSD
jgi:hypothetical protein